MSAAHARSSPAPKKPLTLKGLLALVGAGLLYLVGQALGIDPLASIGGPADNTVGGSPTTPAAPGGTKPQPPAKQAPTQVRDDSQLIQQLFRTMVSDRIVEAEGVVVHVLPVDEVGSRHQNFLLELTNGITLKISHNIDLAPALPNLRKGDTVRFHGEYEYNEKGGVVHWTHRDPRGRHEHGWLEHAGNRYE